MATFDSQTDQITTSNKLLYVRSFSYVMQISQHHYGQLKSNVYNGYQTQKYRLRCLKVR